MKGFPPGNCSNRIVCERCFLSLENGAKPRLYPWDFVWTALDYLGESGIGRWYYSGEAPGEHWQSELFPGMGLIGEI